MHSADLRMDPAAAKAVLERFIALGYVEPQTEGQEKAVAGAVREGKYNLARDYMDCGKYREALPLLEELRREQPDEMRFQLQLAQCYYSLGRNEESKAILDEVLKSQTGKRQESRSEAVEEATGNDKERKAQAEKRAEAARAWADWLLGTMEVANGNSEAGLAALLRAEQAEPLLPNLHVRLGESYLGLSGRIEDARRAFVRALEIDGDSPEAHVGLSTVYLRQRKFEAAASEALIAVGLQHFSPLGHFNLGIALARLGQLDRAKLAFETSLTILPGLALAHRWLGILYRQAGGDAVKATRHRYLFEQLRRRGQQAVTRAGGPTQPQVHVAGTA
jgi:tetratricopeptide (TPR) repeat protein